MDERFWSFQDLASIGSAAFQVQYVGQDIDACLTTGVMAIPLAVGIAIMSDYPIKVGIATVPCACLIGWINAWIRPPFSVQDSCSNLEYSRGC